ncbi:MAG: hypothetical protein M3Q27_03670 [Actinomycetota bacterium]|nr:hypothetical protein [Actinomycetota bacterium]
MTPYDETPQHRRHPSPDALADLTEDLLAEAQAQRLREHVDTCAGCAEVVAALERVRSVLSAEGETVAMPAAVADRLGAALAAEARGGASVGAEAPVPADAAGTGATSAEQSGDDGARTVSLEEARRRRTRRTRVGLQVAASAAVVAALGVVGVQASGGGPGDAAKSAAGGMAAPECDNCGSAGGGGDTSDGEREALARRKPALTASGRDYRDVTELPTVLPGRSVPARQGAAGPTPARTGEVTDRQYRALRDEPLASSRTLRRCADALRPGARVIGVDFARFRGRPAAVLLLEPSQGSGTADVWVVRRSCGTSDTDVLAHRPTDR